MEIVVFLAFLIAISITALASIAPKNRQMIRLLSLQAATIGIVELMLCLVDVMAGLTFAAFIDFLAAFIEWICCVALVPFILYLCMRRTENNVSSPIIGVRKTTVIMVAMTILYLALEAWLALFDLIPPQLETFPLCMLILSESIVVTAIHRDAIKILVGLNLAMNAFYPLLAHLPLGYVALDLVSVTFVNAIATFVIVRSYDEHKTLVVAEWRW